VSQEKLLSDFSGGMNALAAVDKLDPKECLMAENVRLEETGDILSAGAYTHQNTSAYVDTSGNTNIHSLFWNPSLGGVAGVGQDVFTGVTLGSMTSALVGTNTKQQKMSFVSAPNRVYFDVGNIGYWSDMTNLLTVDWAPPSANSGGAGGVTGPLTGVLSGGPSLESATNFGFSIGTSPMQGVQFTILATTSVIKIIGGSGKLVNTAAMLVGGGAVGTPQISANYFFGPQVSTDTYYFGGPTNLFGYLTLTPAQVNAATFGFRLTHTGSGMAYSVSYSMPQATVYQSAGGTGFVAGTGTTGTLTGTYSWKITFVAANGEESDGSVDSVKVTLSGQQGTLTGIPAGDARTASRNIYRIGYSAGTALTLHYLVGSIPDNTTTTYSDNLSDIAAITEGVILAGDVPGDYPNTRLGNTPVRFPVYHYDRLFWINQNQPNQILWSKPLNGFAYPVINTIDVGDSKPISRIVSIFGELIIIKAGGGIWRLTGTDESSFDLSQTPSAVDTDQPFTVTPLPDKLLFANRYGHWIFNGYTSQPLTSKLDLWFRQDDRSDKSVFAVYKFRPPEIYSATLPMLFEAVANSEKCYWTYAQAGVGLQNPDLMILFDLKHANITRRNMYPYYPLSLALDPVTGFVYVGDQIGYISLFDDWSAANGAGQPVNFDFQHGYQDFQRGSNKAFWALEFYINTNGQTLTPYVYYDNGLASETLAPITTSGLQRVVRPLEATASRKAQNLSVRLNGSLYSVNSSGTPQIQVVHIKVLYDIRVGRARTGQ